MNTLAQLKSGALKGITHLKIAEGLTEFPLEIFELADTLEILDLSDNQLSQLPDNFSSLKKLSIAFFSDNLFTEFPLQLASCERLQMIGFKSNRITKIAENALPKNTRWLILTNNKITFLPKSIGDCWNLQKCGLAGNALQNIPTTLRQCENLQLLRLASNQLRQLPEFLFEMPKLAWLAIDGNLFNQFKENFNTDLQQFNWNHIETQELLGEGASGHIYKVKIDETEFALKLFKGEVTSDGLPLSEMQANIAFGEHTHLTKVIGKLSHHPENKDGLVLDLIPSNYKNLGLPPSFKTCTRDTFVDGTQFTIVQIKTIAIGIASACNHLHNHGIMHGDLYAHNILVDENGHVLLGDFGAATLYNRAEDSNFKYEKLDVRAFGYLLDDLLNFVTDANTELKDILTLKNNCLNSRVIDRPTFSEILKTL